MADQCKRIKLFSKMNYAAQHAALSWHLASFALACRFMGIHHLVRLQKGAGDDHAICCFVIMHLFKGVFIDTSTLALDMPVLVGLIKYHH